jgi:hypothetical protein
MYRNPVGQRYMGFIQGLGESQLEIAAIEGLDRLKTSIEEVMKHLESVLERTKDMISAYAYDIRVGAPEAIKRAIDKKKQAQRLIRNYYYTDAIEVVESGRSYIRMAEEILDRYSIATNPFVRMPMGKREEGVNYIVVPVWTLEAAHLTAEPTREAYDKALELAQAKGWTIDPEPIRKLVGKVRQGYAFVYKFKVLTPEIIPGVLGKYLR